jgi:hypothetical protein
MYGFLQQMSTKRCKEQLKNMALARSLAVGTSMLHLSPS